MGRIRNELVNAAGLIRLLFRHECKIFKIEQKIVAVKYYFLQFLILILLMMDTAKSETFKFKYGFTVLNQSKILVFMCKS